MGYGALQTVSTTMIIRRRLKAAVAAGQTHWRLVGLGHPWYPCKTTRTASCYRRETPARRRRFSMSALPQFRNEPHYAVVNQRQTHRLFCASHVVFYSNTTIHPFLQDPYYDKYRGAPVTPELWEQLQQENKRTRQRIDPNLTQQLLQELEDSLVDEDAGLWEFGPTGTWKYQFKVGNDTRRVYQRRLHRDDTTTISEPQVVLEFAPDTEVLAMSLSVDESCIACLFNRHRDGVRHVLFRTIDSNQQKVFQVPDTIVSLELGPIDPTTQNHSVYFVGADESGRPDRILVAQLDPTTATLVSPPALLFQSDDPAVFVDVQRTKGCRFVAIQAMTKVTNEIYLTNTGKSLQLVLPRKDSVQYHLDVGDDDDVVIMYSNQNASGEYALVQSKVSELPLNHDDLPREKKNETDNEYDCEHVLTDMDIFQRNIVLYERSNVTGQQRIRVQPRGENIISSSKSHNKVIPVGDLQCGKITPAGNIHYSATSLRFQHETPAQAGAVLDYNFDTHKTTQIAGKAPTLDMSEERTFVPSADGTNIPLSMIYKSQDDESNGNRPVVLIGYGAYGEPMNLGFDPALAALVQHGFVVAFAHTRGGGDLGKSWYQAGCRENKVKAVEDFEACAHYLKDRWGGPLTAKAFSAGGVIVGAAVNRNPQLFDKMVLTNAFLDVYATMCNPDLFLTAHEWDEYGNLLEDPTLSCLVQSYCPVSNLPQTMAATTFPESLVIGTLDDNNVPYWNALIYAAKARIGTENIYLHIEESGQHHLGPRRLPVSAMELAFIIGR